MRLIDAELLWYGLAGIHVRTNGMCKTTELEKLLNNAPTVDAVEVVRCKDCKHNGTWQCHMEYDEYYPEADIHHEMHGDDDFCSYGVKEDGAE